jgi:thioredoxin 1
MSNYNEIVNSQKLVLIDFFATWCGPCKALAPILIKVKETTSVDLKIVKIDVDKNKSLAQSMQIQGVPTMILYKNGQSVWRQSGVISATELLSIIERYDH